jgi:hypothetical protein
MTKATKQEITNLREALTADNDESGVDEGVVSDIISDVEKSAEEIEQQMMVEDPIGAIRARIVGLKTVNEMIAMLIPKRHVYEQIEKFVRAVRILNDNGSKQEVHELVVDFYIAWVSLYRLEDDVLEKNCLTRDMVREFKASVFARVDEVLVPDWYKQCNSKLVTAQYTAELTSNVIYQATKAAGTLGSRVPEALVETVGRTVLNTSRAVGRTVDAFKRQAEISRLKKEREEIDRKIKDLTDLT